MHIRKRKCKLCNKSYTPKVIFQRCCSARCAFKDKRGPQYKSRKYAKARELFKNCDKCFGHFNEHGKLIFTFCSDLCRAKVHRGISNSLRGLVLDRDGNTCYYCNQEIDGEELRPHVDHVWPKSKKGKDSLCNLITSCHKCNLSKHDVELDKDVLRKIYKVIKHRNKNLPEILSILKKLRESK